MDKLSLTVIQDIVPRSLKTSISQEFIDKLNSLNEDPLLIGSFSENFISYSDALKSGKFSVDDYKHAVLFVSYKLLGSSDIDAYAKTFPDRYKRLKEEQQLTRDQISPYVSAYKRNKLVQNIMEQTLVPSHIVNAPLRQEAINELAKVMVNSRSDMARVAAASKIIDISELPAESKIKLDLGVSDDYVDAISDLKRATEELALAQLSGIKAGKAIKEIAEMNILTKEDIIDV